MSEYDLGMYEKAVPDSLPLDRKMAIAKRCGYDHLEFCVDLNAERAARLDWSRDERKRWRDISWEMNLPFTTFSLSLLRRTPLGLPDRAKNQEAFDVLEKSAELARDWAAASFSSTATTSTASRRRKRHGKDFSRTFRRPRKSVRSTA
jgi:L-ribulose-5-phosphate 3-epimerase UlaE